MKVSFHSDVPTLVLHKAILMYMDTSSKGISYASVHDVAHEDGEPPYLKAGKPITHDAVKEAYLQLLGNQGMHFIEDERILGYGANRMVFFLAGKPRNVLFDCPEPMGRLEGMAPHPSLVFEVHKYGMSVYAVIGHQKPNKMTPLYHAPYMNIYDNGDMCMGNVTPPDIVPNSHSIDAWESAFFDSYFTHANNVRAVAYPGGIYALWQDLLKDEKTTFPEEVLLPIHKHNRPMVLADIFGGAS